MDWFIYWIVNGSELASLDLNNPSEDELVNMETLEFIIYPDGRVQEKVTGIVGKSCAEVTAAIEAQLGQVLSQEATSEYYAQPSQQSVSTQSQATHSNW